MIPQTQHWHTRTPLRVKVLGLLFFSVVLGMLGLLAGQWSALAVSVMAFGLLVLGVGGYFYRLRPAQAMTCDQNSQFVLLKPHPQPVQVRQIWQSAWAVCLLVHEQNQPQHTYCLVFWRHAHCLTAWRYLHIHVLRYQLQHSSATATETV